MTGKSIRAACVVLSAAAFCCMRASPAEAEDKPKDPPLSVKVDKAIDAGVAWLRKQQLPAGTWKNIGGGATYTPGTAYQYPYATTAWVLYTLLKCGVAVDDPGIVKGFEFLKKIEKDRNSVISYELAAVILAVEAKYDQMKREQKREAAAGLKAEPGKRPDLRVKVSQADSVFIGKCLEWLGDRFNEGGWRYVLPRERRTGAPRDVSQTATSMLAILAAHRCGVETSKKTIVSALQWAMAEQDVTGPVAKEAKPADAGLTWAPGPEVRARGWPYVRKTDLKTEPTTTTGNMTTAGLIILLSGQHVLEDLSPEALKPIQPAMDKSVADGIAWLGVNWTVSCNPGSEEYHLMYLYGLERVGDLRRVALLAGHDWYTEGATQLVGMQDPAGFWTGLTHEPKDIINTCFALLFLDRASLGAAITGK